MTNAAQDAKTTPEGITNAKYEVKLIRAPLKPKSDDWQETAHYWVVTINGVSVDYYTGLGHRKATNREYDTLKNKSLTEHGLKELLRYSVPTKPDIKDVLYSLVTDAEAENESFRNWCSTFGYDTDSRKALSIYEACQENADKLRSMKVGKLAELQDFFSDY